MNKLIHLFPPPPLCCPTSALTSASHQKILTEPLVNTHHPVANLIPRTHIPSFGPMCLSQQAPGSSQYLCVPIRETLFCWLIPTQHHWVPVESEAPAGTPAASMDVCSERRKFIFSRGCLGVSGHRCSRKAKCIFVSIPSLSIHSHPLIPLIPQLLFAFLPQNLPLAC